MATVKDFYDEIAPSWYNLRHHTRYRGELERLAKRWGKGRLLNVGTAHGPEFPPFKQGFELHGVDLSGEMLKQARRFAAKFEFAVNLAQADARFLPYRDDSFDWAVSVAAYHHIRGAEERLKALQDLRRVLKPGGEAFITVWNRWDRRFWFAGKEPRVPWRAGNKTLYRYYYLFTFHEFEKLARQAGFEVLESFAEYRYRFPIKSFSRNVCLLVRKGAK